MSREDVRRPPGDNPFDSTDEEEDSRGAVVGEYTWEDYIDEFDVDLEHQVVDFEERHSSAPHFDCPEIEQALGRKPSQLTEALVHGVAQGTHLDAGTYDTLDPTETPVRVGEWTWHHVVRSVHDPDHTNLEFPEDFSREELLGFQPERIHDQLASGARSAEELETILDERTLETPDHIVESQFYANPDGTTTVTNRYDLEKAVSVEKKSHFRELDRYWVNKPYAFVVIFRSEKENEIKYYLIEPHETEIEAELIEFLSEKLKTSIAYSNEVNSDDDQQAKREVIREKTLSLLNRYDLYTPPAERGGVVSWVKNRIFHDQQTELSPELEGIGARPDHGILEEDPERLTEYQVEKILYRLQRDFIGYERIDGIKHDINVEDISCDGYQSPVFVYHTEYEQIISNVTHGRDSLDEFVVKLAQRSGKGISKRQPQVDATLPDGSRAQLTLGEEVSDHGTNYTIRQFKDVPFTPIDLINWRTFSLEEMAFLWLCIENHKSLIFAGGTASGKTTSLNAVSLFIPSNAKIVSIEDTREVELPQRNWIASVTRPSFTEDEKGDVDEFDLLEAALRQRPEYIVMGEIRGQEGRTLFQVMSTGHTTYTTFHADSVGEVLKRFTTDPINVSKTMFTALDLVSVQTQTRVQGRKVRRNKTLTEINHYDPENDEINVQDVYEWEAESDEFRRLGDSSTLDEICFDRGWSRQRLQAELRLREIVLAYLIKNSYNKYQEVAATLQAFINDPDSTFDLIANDELGESLEDLQDLESVLIDVDPEKEELVPRPDPTEGVLKRAQKILQQAEEREFPLARDSSEEIAKRLAKQLTAGKQVEGGSSNAGTEDEGRMEATWPGGEPSPPGASSNGERVISTDGGPDPTKSSSTESTND